MKKIALAILIIVIGLSGCSSEKSSKLKIGDPAPDFHIIDLTGSTFQLSSIKNRPVIIRFFITDCKFCKADTPIFNEYYHKHRSAGLMILYVTTTQDRFQVEKFASDLAIPFPLAIDADRKISQLFNVKVKPQTIILDSNHLIRGALLGGVTEAEMDEIIGQEWLNK